MPPSTPAPSSTKSPYTSYDGFLKRAIERHWDERRNRAHFVALLLASREAWEVAWDGVRAPGTGQKVLTGAAGAAAIVIVLRLLVGGPIGLVLTGLSAISLVTVYWQNHRRIWDQQERYRRVLGEYRARYDRARADYIEGRVEEEERNLMIDGLMNRFLDEIDRDPEEGSSGVAPKSKTPDSKKER